MMRTLIGLLVYFCFFCANAVAAQVIYVDPSRPQFVIKLPANPTTGYQWTVKKYDKRFLQLIENHYVAPKTTRMGASGEMVFTFKIIKGKPCPQTTAMSFVYARPWESKSGTVTPLTINFEKNLK